MKKRTLRRIGLGLAAALLVLAVARFLASGTTATRRPPTAVPVEVARVRTASVPVYLDALGTVVAHRTVTVQPMVTGPLEKVFFHQGQNVRRGQLLAEIDPRPYEAALEQAEAKLAADRATRTSTELQAQQNAALVKKGFVSKQAYVASRAAWLAAVAQVKQDKASVRASEINLGYTRIRAPISGRTGILQVDPGNIVTPNLPNGIVTINTLQPIDVQFSLPQQDLPAINGAMARGSVRLIATIKGESPADRTIDRGVLTVLDNQINTSTGTLTLRGRFPNPRLDLWPGSYVNVRVRVRTLAHVVVVPATAVQEGPSGPFVYLVTTPSTPSGPPRVVTRPVRVTYEGASLAVIGRGLAPGETVVDHGASEIRRHVPVRIVGRTPSVP